MPITKKHGSAKSGLGAAIVNQKKKAAEKSRQDYLAGRAPNNIGPASDGRSVLEQNTLDEFIQQANLAQQDFEAERPSASLVEAEERQTIVRAKPMVVGNAPPEVARKVPIPRRPDWSGMSKEELEKEEGISIVSWRKLLATMEEEHGFVMTPYEKNLDFWRQLWRTIEKSDIVVQIVDARDPLFYRNEDMERYVKEVATHKQAMLLINKSDFLEPALRERWRHFFTSQGTNVLFFSALRELRRQDPSGAEQQAHGSHDDFALAPHGPLIDDPNVIDCDQLIEKLKTMLREVDNSSDDHKPTVGFVGFPNVGKSSVINALFGSKKTSMSRQPGKTKHFQTLEMSEQGLTLCDCPGLVFPSVVATKAHLVVNGTIPLDQLNSFADSIELVVRKMGAEKVARHYGCEAELVKANKELRTATDATEASRVILQALARARGHLLRSSVPDENWSAKRILKDFVTGALLCCEEPPTSAKAPPAFQPPARVDQSKGTRTVLDGKSEGISTEVMKKVASVPIPDSDEDDLKEEGALDGSDLEDLTDFLREMGSVQEKPMTKRAQRMSRKKAEKGSRKEMISVKGRAQ
eukprot:gnl/MRDRNA2_/MRDRNA2_92166_c0_seq1.p1 gnl/MRDRNA2_/MRDRNA2_92166_c0~~gnl/MRDRNA2_/MRDRNA2_92166_c0_seq1.p1  ORF type:complete len:580 (+),score=131.06 gnl/MRDRNA2_/MRDRNA2_92166_c0_seq1:130-1869(+)